MGSPTPSSPSGTKPTVVLVALWGVSHLAPMVELGKRLLAMSMSGRRSSQLTVDVLVVPPPTGKWDAEILDRIRRDEASLPDIRFHHLRAAEPPTDHTGIEEFVSRYVQRYVPQVRAAIVSATAAITPVAAVVVDIFCTTLLDAAQEAGVPAYVFLISSAAMAALLLASPSLDDEVGPRGAEFEDLHGGGSLRVPGLPAPVPASCLPTGLEKRNIPTYDWFLYNGRRYMEASGIIVNTVAELEPGVLAAIAEGRCTRGIPPPAVYTIGPVVAAVAPPQLAGGERCCLRWLDSQPAASVLFVCLGGGGGYFSTRRQVREVAQGLERSGHRFLWVLRGPPEPGTKRPTDADLAAAGLLPPGFAERTKERGLVWPARAPQKDILAHAAVGGFVTHCGWSSAVEGLWSGVPMLPWPDAAEQHFNALTLVAHMRVALAMEVDRKRDNFLEGAELERAVRALMDGGGEAAREVRKRSAEMKAACRGAVEHGGSSVVCMERLYDALIQGAQLDPEK